MTEYRHARRLLIGRRRLLTRGATLGALAAGGPALTACATGFGGGGDDNEDDEERRARADTENPFGVDPQDPLDIVIFKGGFSDEYALYHQQMYEERYGVTPKHLGTQEITGTQQNRFVDGNPPDVLNNSGAQSMDTFALIDSEQLVDLTELLEAPSWDIPDKTVGETLIDGALDPLIVDDVPYGLPYTLGMWGIWHDRALLDEHGWEVPTTWDALMQLGEQIKSRSETDDDFQTSLWIYQGQHPGYMRQIFNQMVLKHGGNEVMLHVDNLEDGAWEQDAIRNVLEAFEELKERGLILPGTAGLTHIQSQNLWSRHRAAFIPCGSWLKNEIGSQLPGRFEMAVSPTPSLDDSDVMPYEAANYYTGENFLLPRDAANRAGGLEYLRIMLSKEGAQKFAELTATLTVVEGAHDDQELDSVLESSLEVIEAARASDRLDQLQYGAWYDEFGKFVDQQLGQLLTADLGPDTVIERVQRRADQTKADDNLTKYTR